MSSLRKRVFSIVWFSLRSAVFVAALKYMVFRCPWAAVSNCGSAVASWFPRFYRRSLGTSAQVGLTVARPPGTDGFMTAKTISVDLDAYERLRRARIRPEESFSQVIKRARWDAPPTTGAALLAALQNAPLADEAVIQRLESAQQEDGTPGDAWTELR